jgi:cholest-4-en-3-one 26-monooxygenase
MEETAMPVNAAELGVLDPDTYANGDPTTFGLPLDRYEYLREKEACFLQEFDNPMVIDRAWVVSRHEDVLEVDRNRDVWAADRGYVNIWKFALIDPIEFPGGKPSMLTLDGDDHRRNRRVISGGFTPKRVEQLERDFRDIAGDVVDAALAKGTFNFVDEVAHLMPLRALGEVLGVPPEDREQFFRWVDTFAAPFDSRIATSFEEVGQAIQDIFAYGVNLRDLRRREPGPDVMSKIAQASDEGQISDDEVMGNVGLLAAGAAESTRSSLSHGLHELMRNPEQMAWLRERADDIPTTAVQEIIRIAAPFIHFVRTATQDTELAGQEIKQGERAVMLFSSANFDPDVFEHPRTFDLTRDPNPHFSFGRGPHSCMGKHVAALEIKVLLEELLQRTKDIRPAGEISYLRDSYTRGVYELPVTVTPA